MATDSGVLKAIHHESIWGGWQDTENTQTDRPTDNMPFLVWPVYRTFARQWECLTIWGRLASGCLYPIQGRAVNGLRNRASGWGLSCPRPRLQTRELSPRAEGSVERAWVRQPTWKIMENLEKEKNIFQTWKNHGIWQKKKAKKNMIKFFISVKICHCCCTSIME